MAREIKFRGKNKFGWHYGYFTKDYAGNCWITSIDGEDTHLVDESTIGQFTGLYDKNGVEIYEGDNVCYETTVKVDADLNSIKYHGVIEFWIGQSGCGWRYKSNSYTMMIKWSHVFRMEVIGNIHEREAGNG